MLSFTIKFLQIKSGSVATMTLRFHFDKNIRGAE